MLSGREPECSRIDALLDLARAGQSGTLLISGEAGIGKSALLLYAAQRAGDMRVLSACGVPAERQLPYAGLSALTRPVLDRLDTLPSPAAGALRGALALGPSAAGDRFAVYAGLLALLAHTAEERPVLVVLDDLQWWDEPSYEAMLFSARRLDADAVAVVGAFRDGWRATGAESATGRDEFEELRLGGLAPGATEAVIAAKTGRALPGPVLRRLTDETNGNPLALLEALDSLEEAQLAGWQPLNAPLPRIRTAQDIFAPRVSALPAAARHALLIASVHGTGELAPVLAAATRAGVSAEAFEELEHRGLIGLKGGSLVFPHPLVRSAAYALSSAREQRAAHHALAEVLTAPADRERRIWHLAEAAVAPHEPTARSLETIAALAKDRSGYAAAAQALERAALLSPEAHERTRRLFDAAEMARLSGATAEALRLLDACGRAAAPREPGQLRARIEHMKGRIEIFAGHPAEAAHRLRRAAEACREEASAQELLLLTDAAMAALLAGDALTSLVIADQVRARTEDGESNSRLISTLIIGAACMHTGQIAEGLRHLADASRLASREGTERPDIEYVIYTAIVLSWTADYTAAFALIEPLLDELRTGGALGILPLALYASSYAEIRAGRLSTAHARATEASGLARDTGNDLWQYFALGVLALAEAHQGEEAACREHAAMALDLRRGLTIEYPRDAYDALGLLELTLGHVDAAATQFDAAHSPLDAGVPVLDWPSAADLVEVYVKAGRPVDEAMRAEILRQSEDREFPANAALAWRCRGLLAPDEGFAPCFDTSLALHAVGGSAFEEARTLLCYGERTRRHGSRRAARRHIRAAELRFTRMGARLWADRARAELRAAGETARRPDAMRQPELTSQELNTALTVSRGFTNRETAAALFISPKTVEMHLSSVYRKLGIRTRTQLARHFMEPPFSGGPRHA
ncbi:AAA family ATPase [Streptomyces sp. SYP-A7185]|uniref:helix-turn-helix transcriptional regulator n=1 Tax=Streptomyces sp. SYP-A7185 TaxID=3040076 RepID=UPI0038F69658